LGGELGRCWVVEVGHEVEQRLGAR